MAKRIWHRSIVLFATASILFVFSQCSGGSGQLGELSIDTADSPADLASPQPAQDEEPAQGASDATAEEKPLPEELWALTRMTFTTDDPTQSFARDGTMDFEYDADGMLVHIAQKTRVENLKDPGHKTAIYMTDVDFAYDAQKRLISVSNQRMDDSAPDKIILKMEFGYDGDGSLLSRKDFTGIGTDPTDPNFFTSAGEVAFSKGSSDTRKLVVTSPPPSTTQWKVEVKYSEAGVPMEILESDENMAQALKSSLLVQSGELQKIVVGSSTLAGDALSAFFSGETGLPESAVFSGGVFVTADQPVWESADGQMLLKSEVLTYIQEVPVIIAQGTTEQHVFEYKKLAVPPKMPPLMDMFLQQIGDKQPRWYSLFLIDHSKELLGDRALSFTDLVWYHGY